MVGHDQNRCLVEQGKGDNKPAAQPKLRYEQGTSSGCSRLKAEISWLLLESPGVFSQPKQYNFSQSITKVCLTLDQQLIEVLRQYQAPHKQFYRRSRGTSRRWEFAVTSTGPSALLSGFGWVFVWFVVADFVLVGYFLVWCPILPHLFFCFVGVFCCFFGVFLKQKEEEGSLPVKRHRSAPFSIWAQENTAAILFP